MSPAATWSRVRRCEHFGQRPLRSRAHPFGLEKLDSVALTLTQQSNAHCEFEYWLAEQALTCSTCRIIVISSEDFECDVRDGPSSIWSCQVFQELENLHVARRCAAFGSLCGGILCQLASVDVRRPLGILSNIPGLLALLHMAWPSFSEHSSVLEHTGPLPKSCHCVFTQKQFNQADEKFLTSDTGVLGTRFWQVQASGMGGTSLGRRV